MASVDTVWWGTRTIPRGRCGRWRIGPSVIWIQRLPGEWRIASEPAGGSDDVVEVEVPVDGPDLLELDTAVRFGTSAKGDELTAVARLADRPVVTRPYKPFFIPPGESVTLFVGSPLWLSLSIGDDEPLEDMPIERPADTWFGPPTDDGQLCYASRSECRLHREGVIGRPHRALSAVRVRNRAKTEFLLERMQLPVEYLELYRAADGALVSQDVELERVEGDAPAPMTVRRGAPELAPRAELVSPARKKASHNVLIGAFTRLFR